MIDLADLEAKALAATRGEWSVEPHGSTRALYSGRHDVGHGLRLLNLDDGDWNIAANAAYIVAAQPSVVLELIERVRAAEAKAAEPDAYKVSVGSHVDLAPTLHMAREIADPYEGAVITQLYAAPPDVSALQERVRVLEEALRVAFPYIAAQVNDDGGIDNCEIGDRLAYERTREVLGGSNE